MSNQSWKLLGSLTFRHRYYNAQGEICPDLALEPTPYTESLMRTHGLRLRPVPGGAEVYYLSDPAYTPPSEDAPLALARPWPGTLTLTLALRLTNPRVLRVTESPVPNVRQQQLWRVAEGDSWTVYPAKPGAFRYSYPVNGASTGTVAVMDAQEAPVAAFPAVQVGESDRDGDPLLAADIDLQTYPPGLYTVQAQVLGTTVQEDTFYVVPQSGSVLPLGIIEVPFTLTASGEDFLPPTPSPTWNLERDTASVSWRYLVTLTRSFDKYNAMRVKDSASGNAATGLAELDDDPNVDRPAPEADMTTTTEYPVTWIRLMTDNPTYDANQELVFESVASEADLTSNAPNPGTYKVYERPNDRLQLEGRVASGGGMGGGGGQEIWEILKDKLPNPPLGRASLDINITL